MTIVKVTENPPAPPRAGAGSAMEKLRRLAEMAEAEAGAGAGKAGAAPAGRKRWDNAIGDFTDCEGGL